MHSLLCPFSFSLPTEIEYGSGCIDLLPEKLAFYGGKKPLLVSDPGVAKAGILGRITALLQGVPYAVYDKVEANPKDRNAEEGARLARAEGCDCLIAVGGGSPIDCAKSIGVLLAHDAAHIKPYEGKTAATKPLPLFITIPTTAGTGSELTFSSVITDTENKYKMTVKSRYTAARLAICDPELTLSVPPAVTAATGVDALTHAIEAYTANCAEPISDAVALYATELIYGNLLNAYQNGGDLAARSGMLMGSMLAGIAFSHSDVASVHCVAESLGGLYDLPHGVCNAIFLPYVMEYNMDYCRERYARLGRAMGLSFSSAEEGATAAVDAVKRLCADVQLPSFKSLGIDTADFDAIAQMSVANISTASNPRPMEKSDYLNVLRSAYHG
ncbi:MAG: iron-containing alcohol dehydrogenase [Clostridia bacterium]|nr:iron-containing alcohol dehydrogenase [Clostridia bacterium]